MPNAADRKSIRRQEKAARLAERERADVLREIMATSNGRAWLWERLAECNMFHTTHVPGDALASAFQEGRRSVGLSFLADIMAHCPDLYIQAMRESHERNILERIRDDDTSTNPTDSADAERRGSPVADGGDSGALADSGPDDETSDPGIWQNPGHDIYTETRGKA